MNTHTFRTTVAATTLLLLAGCGTAVSDEAKAPRSVPQQQTQVDAGATYDGWQARLRRPSPPVCAPTPDQVERVRESGRPLALCVKRQQRWFRAQYDPDWVPNGPTAGR